MRYSYEDAGIATPADEVWDSNMAGVEISSTVNPALRKGAIAALEVKEPGLYFLHIILGSTWSWVAKGQVIHAGNSFRRIVRRLRLSTGGSRFPSVSRYPSCRSVSVDPGTGHLDLSVGNDG